MLPSDEMLDSVGRQYERARIVRRSFQGVVTLAVVVVTALVAAVGVERLVSAYAFVALWLGFQEAQRRFLRHIGETTNIEVSSEFARVTPFAALVSYTIAWIGAGELLLGTGALSDPFSVRVQAALSVMLLAAAVGVTWRSHSQVLHDRVATLVWFALLVPTLSASPRSAWWVLSVARVVAAFALHMVLMARSELRVSVGKLESADANSLLGQLESLASVTRVASNNAARKLAQTAWVLLVWPPLIVVGGAIVVVLNEYAGTTPPRQRTSPRVSPRRRHTSTTQSSVFDSFANAVSDDDDASLGYSADDDAEARFVPQPRSSPPRHQSSPPRPTREQSPISVPTVDNGNSNVETLSTPQPSDSTDQSQVYDAIVARLSASVAVESSDTRRKRFALELV